jgi:hypothetical protein
MCEPATLMAIASTTMNVMGAAQEHQAQKAKYNANVSASHAAQIDEQRQLNIQKAQTQESAAQEKIATDLKTREMASRVVATDTGAVQNNNPILQDIMRQGLESNTMVSQNLERTDQQHLEALRGAKSKTQSRINSVSKPSSTATGLKIASALASGASDYTAAGGTWGAEKTTPTGGFNTRRS